MDDSKHDYYQLNPNTILNAIESKGFACNGQLLALNSYENRVYQIGIHDQDPVVAKFYRPQRWSDAAILEELEFAKKLFHHEIPVVAPLPDADNHILFEYQNFRFALFPRYGGYPPQLDNSEHLKQLGRLIARIHAKSSKQLFLHRQNLDPIIWGERARQTVLSCGFLPMELENAYSTLTVNLMQSIDQCYQRAGKLECIRLHGDCHAGNILNRDEQFFLLDFDDAANGPAIQDLWMFLSGDIYEMSRGLSLVLEGYTQFRDFNPAELNLIEALRSLRLMHYAAWIAKRWDDPAFPKAFPWFDSIKYWENHILELREQLSSMQEQPIVWS